MQKIAKAALIGLSLVGACALAATAPNGQALAQSNGCFGCHDINVKKVGPAYKDVAAKYRGNKAAEALLIKKVKNGGSGVWGPMMMPGQAQLKDAEVKTLVQWVLSIK